MFKYYLSVLSILSLCLVEFSYANNIPAGCTYKSEVCVEGAGTREIDGVPVYQDCWRWQQNYRCPDWSQYKNSCDNLTNCVADGDSVVINPYEKQQQYKCTSYWREKKCATYEDKTTCAIEVDYANGNQAFRPSTTDNFGKNMAYMQMLNAINQNMTAIGADLRIFTGEGGSCKQPKKRGVFGNDCCDINLSEYGSWHQNQCDAFDLKIAMARRNNRAVHVGTWCSIDKEIIGCLENRQGYCLFADEMAKIIQEQGRAQINERVTQGSTARHSLTQHIDWQHEDRTAHWNRFMINGVDIAAYSYTAFNKQNAVINTAYTMPVKLANNSSQTSGDVTMSMYCTDGICRVTIVSGGQMDTIRFDPTCQRIPLGKWVVADSLISQNQCVSIDKTPVGWAGLTWNNSNPSFWIFNLSAVTSNVLSGSDVNWRINNNSVTGKGNCSDTACLYDLMVTDRGQHQTGTLQFPFNCQENQHNVTINGYVFAPKCTPKNNIMAICTTGKGCGALPNDVQTNTETLKGINGWTFFRVDNPTTAQKFITRNIAIDKGQCDALGKCSYQITSLGQHGYQDVLETPITFNLFSAPVDKEGVAHPDYRVCNQQTTCDYIKTTGGFMLRPYQYAQNQTVTDSIKALYRLSLSNEWQALNIPVNIDKDHPLTLSDKPTLKLWGKCDVVTGLCHYTIAESISITAKSWGEPQNPDCSGFKPEELQFIDFSKIDLSSYIQRMQRELTQQQQDDWTHQASGSVDDFKNKFTHAQDINYHSPQGEQVVKISPSSGTGGSQLNPFTVTLSATSNFPKYYPYGVCDFDHHNKNSNPVSQVVIDWGDGSAQTTLTTTSSITHTGLAKEGINQCDYTVPIFTTTHTYQAPPNNQTTKVPVTVQLYTQNNGIQTTVVTVQNIYENGVADDGSHSGGLINNAQQIKLNQGSNGKLFDPKEVVGIQTSWE